jgi:hypothetical protein
MLISLRSVALLLLRRISLLLLLFPLTANAFQVSLAWDANTEADLAGYRVFQREEGQSYDYSYPVYEGTTTGCSVPNLIEGVTYYFVVRAFDTQNFESANSEEVSTLVDSSTSTQYSLAVDVNGSGSVVADPSGGTYPADTTVVLTATPDVGWTFSNWSGATTGTSPTAAVLMDSHKIVTANFAQVTYTISASTYGNGSISPVGTVTVAEGAEQTFVIAPSTDSYLVDVLVDGVSIGAVSDYTFSQVVSNHTISAEFAYYTHTILATADTGGSISPSGSLSVDHGNSQGFTITAASGYRVADVLVDGSSVGSVSTYTFDPVVENHTIHAAFIADTVTITSSAGTNGTITPAGSVNVSIGGSQSFTIYPDTGYTISDVMVDGVSVGIIDNYTFTNVTADHTIIATFAAVNQPPMADAGPDQVVEEGQTVLLSGLNSMDLDDGIAAFQWRQIQGVQVTLNSPGEPETTFTTPDVDTSGTALVFELSVTDYSGSTSVDTCIVNVTWVNLPPRADAGIDQTVNEGSQVLLDASNSTDPDDGIVSYTWKQLLGPVVIVSDANSATPIFVAPDVESEGTALTFEVTVTDAGGLQGTDTCLINVTWVNTPPVADAGLDQNVLVGSEVLLDGSNSYDAEDLMITSFKWHQTGGVPVELSDATAQRPNFLVPAGAEEGSPLTFDLTVTDSGGLQGKDTCQTHVQPIGPTLYVSSVTMELKKKGPNYEANAYVKILDAAGRIAKEANLTGLWALNGNPINTVSTTTRGDGIARLASSKISARKGDVFKVQITGVAKDGYTYDPLLNTVTEHSIIVP